MNAATLRDLGAMVEHINANKNPVGSGRMDHFLSNLADAIAHNNWIKYSSMDDIPWLKINMTVQEMTAILYGYGVDLTNGDMVGMEVSARDYFQDCYRRELFKLLKGY